MNSIYSRIHIKLNFKSSICFLKQLHHVGTCKEKRPCLFLKPSNDLNWAGILLPKSFQSSSKCTHNMNEMDVIKNKISDNVVISNDFVEQLKSEIFPIGRINENNFGSLFLQVCRNERAFSLGKDFFKLLYSQGNFNLGTTGKFFRLCYDFSTECSESDKKFIVDLCKELLQMYPVLDFMTCENTALALSITNNWKECLQLLEISKVSSQPSQKMYSAIIIAAFSHKEFTIANNLLIEMLDSGKQPTIEVYKAWMETTDFSSKGFFEILHLLEKYDIHILDDMAEMLIDFCKTHMRASIKKPHITSIHSSGRCLKCSKQLKPVNISQGEFVKLRNAFLNPVLIGKDIFLKTRPEEFDTFLRFLHRIGKVDIVLDGLNIAYSQHNRKQCDAAAGAKMVHDVVKHFVRQRKKVVVFGRKHMAGWPEDKMLYIKKNSHLFLTDNLSSDDPFLLYTAMHSGLNTIFVSRDQMRSHKFLLNNLELRSIFSRWQQLHQYSVQYVSPTGIVRIADPVPYLQSVQESAPGVWHVPIYLSLEGVSPYLVPKMTKWLCLS